MMNEQSRAREKFEKKFFRESERKKKGEQTRTSRMSDDATKRVRVVARVRPPNAKEIDEPLTILDAATGIVPDGAIRATLPMSAQLTRELTFNFSAVAGARATQSDVYDASAKSLVAPFLNGVNCAVLAYGNTSSGKTFTMMGPSFADEAALAGAATMPSAALTGLASHELAGVIPRMLADVFDALARIETIHVTHELRCSFIEVYREECFDLLVTDTERVPLHMRENKAGEVLLPGARSELATSIADVMSLLERGSRHRVVACTNANRDSSRGHAIFLVSCRRTDKRTKFATESQLYLCDLAGSEKIVKTGVTGVQLKEAAAINQSLLALGNVIQALSTGDGGHVPFRSSKLTRLLKSPLSSATVLIVCVSPSSLYAPETVATLRFGDRSQLIKGHARVNAVRSVEFLEHALARAEARIAELEAMANERRGRRSDISGDDFESDGDHDDSDVDDTIVMHGKSRLHHRDSSDRRYGLPAIVDTKSVESASPMQQRPQLDDLVHFLCPLSRGVFADPVVAADGITYERLAIERWFKANPRTALSPVFGRPLAHRNLVSNLLCKAQLQLRFQASQKQDILYILPFDWVFQPLVLEVVVANLVSVRCALTFRAVCRRFRDLIDSKHVLLPLTNRLFPPLGQYQAAGRAMRSAPKLVEYFLSRAHRAMREEASRVSPQVTFGVQLTRSPQTLASARV